MKIKVSTILIIIFAVNTIALHHFYYIISFPPIIDNLLSKYALSIINGILGLVIGIGCLSCYKDITKPIKKRLTYYYFLFCLAYILMLIYTMIKYPEQSVLTSIKFSASFLSVFLIPLYYVLFRKRDGFSILDFISFISFAWNLMIIIQVFFHSMTGVFALDFGSYFTKAVYERVYGVRIRMGVFGHFSLVYSFVMLYNKELIGRKKIFNIIQIAVGLVVLVFVEQSRLWMAVVALCIAVQILSSGKSTKTRLKELLLLSIAFIFLFSTGFLSSLISGFIALEAQEGYASSTGRLYGLRYYLDCIGQNPILGNGFVSGEAVPAYFAVEHGPLGIAYYSDLAIIGLFAETGLLSIIFYIIPVCNLVKQYLKIKKTKKLDRTEVQILLSMVVYLVLTSFTSLITNFGSEALFPMILAYGYYLECKSKSTTYPNKEQTNVSCYPI